MGRIRRTFCNHYRAIIDHETCEVGVLYDKFKGMAFDKLPCFREVGKEPNPGCELAQFPTVEELKKLEEEQDKMFENIGKARDAIVAHFGGTWKKGMAGSAGAIACPVCTMGQLRFSRSGYNGHIHAQCSTKDCVAWME